MFRNLVLIITGAILALGVEKVASENIFGGKSPAAPSSNNSNSTLAKAPSSDAILSQRRNSIVTATEKAAPAVVSITVLRSTVVRMANPFFDDPFFNFFGGQGQYKRKEVSSLGSGVIADNEGHVITNSHVLGNDDGSEIIKLTVTLSDGRHFEATPIGIDPNNDLALLQIKGENLPFASLQVESDNLIGEWAIAIGNPYGYLIGDPKPTVTVGVISAVNRSFSSQSGIHYHDMIQTDAAINPGNSGGALVNSAGDVIGINTFIFTGGAGGQGSIGLGFAIPIQKAIRVMKELLQYGYIREFTTGIFADPSVAEAYGGEVGVVITALESQSPGEKAGLRAGDIITKIADRQISSLSDIRESLSLFQVGETIELQVSREGKLRVFKMLLEEKPRQRNNNPRKAR